MNNTRCPPTDTPYLLDGLARAFLQQTPDLVLLLDAAQRVLALNPAFERATGLASGQSLGRTLDELRPFGAATPQLLAWVRADVPGTGQRTIHIPYPASDGTPRVYACQLSTLAEAVSGGPATMLVASDVTRCCDAERALAIRNRDLRSLADNLPDPVMRHDAEGRAVYANRAVLSVLGLRADEIIGRRALELPAGAHFATFADAVSRAMATAQQQHTELRWRPAGSPTDYVHHIHTVPEFDAHGRCVSALSVGRDFTDLAEHQAKVEQLARTDHLTGLLNRMGLHEQAPRLLQRAAEHGAIAGVLMLDLDGFKAVNDRCGHAVGDCLLRETAARLSTHLRQGDLVARLGGDEFVIVVADDGTGRALAAVLRRLRRATSRLQAAGSCEASPVASASIGLARYPDDGQSFERLLERADQAMYRAKARRHRQRSLAG